MAIRKFDDFLGDEGLPVEAETVDTNLIISFKLQELMQEQKLRKVRLAKRMKPSCCALDRLLDPDNASVTLLTLERAAEALDKCIRIKLAA